MKTVNKQGIKVLEFLRGQALVTGNQYAKLDRTEGTFMPVSVEMLAANGAVELWAIGHWFTQNGDAMRDPEVCFIRLPTKVPGEHEWYPVSFRMDPLGINREFVHLNGELLPTKWYDNNRQADVATFCGEWMSNIKQQQQIRV